MEQASAEATRSSRGPKLQQLRKVWKLQRSRSGPTECTDKMPSSSEGWLLWWEVSSPMAATSTASCSRASATASRATSGCPMAPMAMWMTRASWLRANRMPRAVASPEVMKVSPSLIGRIAQLGHTPGRVPAEPSRPTSRMVPVPWSPNWSRVLAQGSLSPEKKSQPAMSSR